MSAKQKPPRKPAKSPAVAFWANKTTAPVRPPETPLGASPTPERRDRAQIDGERVERIDGREFIDAEGNVATPFRVVDTLELMHRRGTITDEMRAAGLRFRSAFATAGIDTLKAHDLARVSGGALSADSVALRAQKARDDVYDMIRASGGIASPGGSCLFHVLGWGQSLAEWAKTQGWHGRSLTPHAAAWVFKTALAVIAENSRLTRHVQTR